MEAESRITGVTLYAGGARVRRATTIAIAASEARVRVIGLPITMLDDTLRIEADGDAIVASAHVGLDAPAPDVAAGEDGPELRAGRQRVALADAEIERIDAALAILAAAPIALPGPDDEPPPAWSAIVETRRTLVALRAARELALRDQVAAARHEADEARRALAAAIDRDRRASSARPARLHELRKHVELELDLTGGTGSATVYLEYQVAAARWSPSYVARFDGARVAFELRAMVAQDTGEDWAGVALRLSTAEPERFGALPELAAQRIGRRQTEPPRRGFRAPPTGAAALYLDYLRAFPEPDARRIGLGRIAAASAPAPRFEPLLDSIAGSAPMLPPAPAPLMASAARPGDARRRMTGPMKTVMMSAPEEMAKVAAPVALEGMASFAQSLALPPAPEPPAPAARLDYANLRMAPPGSPDRGTLVPAPQDPRSDALAGEVAMAVARVVALTLPVGFVSEWPHAYDYAFATDGAVDVRSDGAWHSIAVTATTGSATLRHVAVPREQADVFRIATLTNPLAGPLLPGPIDVYDRGTFLVTSEVEHTPPGARVDIGLGVDPQVKLSRNTEFREETTGVLRGGLRLHHAIRIDVDNRSERAIELEVRERLPVTRDGDDDVAVVIGRIEPAWERVTPDASRPHEPVLRGGYRWRLPVPAGATCALRAAYEVRIAGKHELVGGNRRES